MDHQHKRSVPPKAITPKGVEVDIDGIKGSLKALHPQTGDMLVMRLNDALPDDLARVSEIMGKALDGIGMRGKAVGIVMSSDCDIECIPADIARKVLTSIVEQKLVEQKEN
jgi:hypothetical protein